MAEISHTVAESCFIVYLQRQLLILVNELREFGGSESCDCLHVCWLITMYLNELKVILKWLDTEEFNDKND